MLRKGSWISAALASASLAGACVLAAAPAAAGAATRASMRPGTCAGAHLDPTSTSAAVIDRATLCLIDRVRAASHVRPLRANTALGAVAGSQVGAMVTGDYFADVRPSGQTPMSLVVFTNYPWHTAGISVGQNIAWGTGTQASPASIVAAWMASPPHREIMLSGEYRDAGIAVAPALPSVLGARGEGATYAAEFGVRRF